MSSSLAVTALCSGLVIIATCDHGDGGNQTNRRPLAPRVNGPDSVVVGEQAEFSLEVYDPDGDEVRVFVAWGDGDTTDYGEFVSSGRVVWFRHAYRAQGTYLVRGRCQDARTSFSTWSAGRPVTVIPPLGVCLTSEQRQE